VADPSVKALRSNWPLSAVLLSLACSAAQQLPVPAAPAKSAAPSATLAAPSDAGAARASDQAPASDQAQALEYRRDQHYPPDSAVDVAAWLKAHGVKNKLRGALCWDAADSVGVPAQPGLVCLSTTHRPTRTVATIHRVEGASLAVVWQGVVGTHENWLELTPLLAPDGTQLHVHDSREGACGAALAEYSEKQQSGVHADFGDVLREGCRMRGPYVFREGRYVPRVPSDGGRAP
jgi:hypothetical protein